MDRPYIGTAGWSLSRQAENAFPAEGSGLERYSTQFSAAEINSSFYRPHRISTWARWRDSTPADFRFSVKIPKLITHEQKLVGCGDLLDNFLGQANTLGDKLAVLLVQLPPKLEFGDDLADGFFYDLRSRTATLIACEPRHASWFTPAADTLLARHTVSRVAADPAICSAGAKPGGWSGLNYWRLHGSPDIYRSSYAERLTDYAKLLRNGQEAGRRNWCIFDNTASGAAITDALCLQQRLHMRETEQGSAASATKKSRSRSKADIA